MKKYSDEEFINKYINGELNEQEIQEFKQKLENDSDFAEMYKDFAETESMFLKVSMHKKKKDFEDFMDNYNKYWEEVVEDADTKYKKTKIIQFWNNSKIRLLAAACVVIFAFFAGLYSNSFISEDKSRDIIASRDVDEEKDNLEELEKQIAQLKEEHKNSLESHQELHQNYLKNLAILSEKEEKIEQLKNENNENRKNLTQAFFDVADTCYQEYFENPLASGTKINNITHLEPDTKITSESGNEVYFFISPVNNEINFKWKAGEIEIIDSNNDRKHKQTGDMNKINSTSFTPDKIGYYKWVLRCNTEENEIKEGGFFVF
jgi:hypothetical protein